MTQIHSKFPTRLNSIDLSIIKFILSRNSTFFCRIIHQLQFIQNLICYIIIIIFNLYFLLLIYFYFMNQNVYYLIDLPVFPHYQKY